MTLPQIKVRKDRNASNLEALSPEEKLDALSMAKSRLMITQYLQKDGSLDRLNGQESKKSLQTSKGSLKRKSKKEDPAIKIAKANEKIMKSMAEMRQRLS